MSAEPHNDHSIFEEIAALLPAEQREHFYRRMACLRRLGPDDEIMQIAEAMGFLAILIRDTPQLLVAERRAVETLLQQTIAIQQALHDNIKKSNAQIEDMLLDLPAEIQAGINPDTIATQLAESIRQAFVQTQLPTLTNELRSHTAAINDATRQLGSLAATLGDPEIGAAARVRQATATMIANITSGANHVRFLAKNLSAEIRHSIAVLCAAALALGFLLGYFVHQ